MNNQITVSGILRSAWTSFSENISYVYYLMVPMFALSLIGTLVYPEVGNGYFGANQVIDVTNVLLSAALTLLSIVLGIFSTISLLFFLRSGKKDTYASWKGYFRLLPKYIVVCILQGLMILAGLILFIIPGIYLALRYAFVSYRTLEHPTESIANLFAAEAQATKGNRGALFLVILSLFALTLVAGMLLALIFNGLLGAEGNAFVDFIFELIFTPFFTVVSIITYLQLTGSREAEEGVSDEAEPEIKAVSTEEAMVVSEPTAEEPEEKKEEEKEEPKPAATPVVEPVA